jgi:hypothetical protein
MLIAGQHSSQGPGVNRILTQRVNAVSLLAGPTPRPAWRPAIMALSSCFAPLRNRFSSTGELEANKARALCSSTLATRTRR